MSRLIVNNTDDRVICIIKNFASIELVDDTLKIIDKFGLSEFDIFEMNVHYNTIEFNSFAIRTSNAYGVELYRKHKYWSISNAVLNELRVIFVDYYFKRLELSITNHTIKIDKFKINFNSVDNIFNIEYEDAEITDYFVPAQPISYYDREIVLLGKSYYVYMSEGDSNLVLIHNSDYFPKSIYSITLQSAQISVLRTFMSSCLNLTNQIDEFLLVKKLL